MVYAIFEGNMERLEKKLNRIYNKCKAYGCEFHYEKVGETFKELKDSHGKSYMARFILVEAKGTAIVNDWEFVASVEQTEKGNIFTGKTGIEVPARYYTAVPVCEHCHTNRYRKYTYIVRNKKTGEFKQVGKSCLQDFTHGMSAEMVAQYISLFDSLIKGEAPDPGSAVEHYLSKEEYLRYAAETIRHFGYVKADESRNNTAVRALDYYEASHGRAVSKEYLSYLQKEMADIGFDPDCEIIRKQVKDALSWISDKPEENNYIHNLKTVCGLEYVTYKNVNLLASLFPASSRDLAKAAERDAFRNENHSRHIGSVGDKIVIKVKTIRCMKTWEGNFGPVHLYKIIDDMGNVYIWKTGKLVDTDFVEMTLKGTVKAHNEFKGVKQTEMTKCVAAIVK